MTEHDPTCCEVSRENDNRSSQCYKETRISDALLSTKTATDDDDRTKTMVRLEGRQFTMGTDSEIGFAQDGEGPEQEVTVKSFYIDKYAVTNAEFLTFVRETNYLTDAERYGWSFIFEDILIDGDQKFVIQNVPEAPWWVAVKGANWLRPYGPSSSVLDNKDLLKHPVTHVSWHDAQSYAKWAGKRLPTEAEWEYAARGGLKQKHYPWGDDLKPDDEHRCNIWQGEFPEQNTRDDGYLATAPVNEFKPNDYGLYNVVGNVWEWCADWFSSDYHKTANYSLKHPTGPPNGDQRVMRGGSYLCHRSWCNRYRVSARSKNTPDSSTGNIGFRCVVDAAADGSTKNSLN